MLLGDIDVVITHDWPSGIRDGKGTELIRGIAETLQPQIHVCGHMHSYHEAIVGKTAVYALNAVPSAIMGECVFLRNLPLVLAESCHLFLRNLPPLAGV